MMLPGFRLEIALLCLIMVGGGPSLGAESIEGLRPVSIDTACVIAASESVRARFDLPYYDPDDSEGPFDPLLANLWFPDTTRFTPPHPVVVLVHGGCGGPGGDSGGGCRSVFGTRLRRRLGHFLAGHGYIAAAPQYRYVMNHYDPPWDPRPETDLARLPAPIQDLRCFLRWIRTTDQYGLDRADDQAVVLHGSSGGGYFSLLVAALGEDPSGPIEWDNPLCSCASIESVGDSAAAGVTVQGVAVVAPRIDDRPYWLDSTPPALPPEYPRDWRAANGELAHGSYWYSGLVETLDHIYGSMNFPSAYDSDPDLRQIVDGTSLLLRASANWPPIYVAHSVFDDLNYFEGVRKLRDEMLLAGLRPGAFTLVPVGRALSGSEFRSTLYCWAHDFDLFENRYDADPLPHRDRNYDGRIDYDPHSAFCTFSSFLERYMPVTERR